ncbi:MAG: ISNCY family transposase [candidate division Zixibacteria bacterium]|nr:ISNCY family transposase [candidate division Zixibacteria bacterium]
MLNLTMKEAERYKVISEVNGGYLKVGEAAEILGLSERQVYRIKARVEREGAGGVIHKRKGKKTSLWLTDKICDKIDHLYRTKYRGFNLTHMTEFLNEEEGIKVSRESVRQILLEKGSYTKQRRHPQHRQWREPCSREGQMVQFDTSDHDWLEGRGPKLYLIGGVDDATSKVAWAKFVLTDGVSQIMEVFWGIVRRRGIPLSVYVDCGSNFKTTRHQSMEYQLKGEYPSTQFARALEELGARIIYAYSPQAKGRIERKFGVFQDRLCSELRLHNISTLEEANRYLWEKFMPKHNQMFSRTVKEPGSAYRPLPKGLSLKDVFCLKEERTVAGDNTISYRGKTFQILPNEYRLSFFKAKVEVHEYLDGSINIFYQGKKLKHKPISKEKIKSFSCVIEQKETELVTMNY